MKKLFPMLTLLLPVTASAGLITTFSDRAAFDAAVGTTVVEDFGPDANFPITSGILNSFTNEAGILPGDIAPGVTYSTEVGTGNFFNIDAGGGFQGGFLDSIVFPSGERTLTVNFDTAVAAFGFDTNSLMGSAFSLLINFSDGTSTEFSQAVGSGLGLQFFGYQSSLVDIDSLNIRGNNTTFNFALDNFTFGGGSGSVSPVPAPGALSLLGLCLAGMGVARRRQQA